VHNSPAELLTALTINKKRNNPRRTKINYRVQCIFLFVTVIKLDSESLKHEATGGGKNSKIQHV
jgi:hypothetical protein